MATKVETATTITLEHAALKDALAFLTRVVERRNTIPILGNVLLRIEVGAIRMKATDLDIEAETVIEAVSIEGSGATTVSAAMLHDIVRKLPGSSQIVLSWNDHGQATVKAGRSRFMLHTLPADDYPDIAAGEMPHRFALPVATLREIIETVDFAMSTEEKRYYLNGIYLHHHEQDGAARLRAVATDGHRLALIDAPAPEGTAGMPGVIVPRKTVAELAKMSGGDEVVIELSPAKIRVTCGPRVLTSKLIDATFPDYQRVIPARNGNHATLDREEVATAADRVSTIASERGRAVRCEFTGGKLKLSVSNPDAGTAEDEVAVEYDGAEQVIGFNARYLADCLAAIGGDTVRLAMGDPGRPALFRRATSEDMLVVLMPMRV